MSGQDVMMWLSMGSLHVLHERFTENDGELDVQQFCEIMMELCVMREEEDAVHKCRRLIDLFVQIDVNGDGSMEWDELSAFIIESGMAASSKAKIGLRLTYDAITSLVHNCRRKEVVQLEYIRSASSLETGLAPVPHPASGGGSSLPHSPRKGDRDGDNADDDDDDGIEKESAAASTSDSLIDCSGFLAVTSASEVNFHLVKPAPRSGVEKESLLALRLGSEGEEILAMHTLPELDLVVACTDRLRFAFWDFQHSDKNLVHLIATKSERKRSAVAALPSSPDYECSSGKNAQHLLAWSWDVATQSGKLFTAARQAITAWEVKRVRVQGHNPDGKATAVSCVKLGKLTLPGLAPGLAHTDIVETLLVVPSVGVLCSAGFDGNIHLWGVDQHLEHRGTRSWHTKGVKVLAWSTTADVLLSGGFDYDILAWNIRSQEDAPLLRLTAHAAPIIDITSFETMVYTLDATGHFRLWDLRQSSAILESERMLHSFTIGKSVSHFAPNTMCLLPGSSAFAAGSHHRMPDVVSGDDHLRWWLANPGSGSDDFSIVSVCYNPTFMTIVVVTQIDVFTFSAIDGSFAGKLDDVMDSVGSSQRDRPEIQSTCFDSRFRKLLIGSAKGEITVHNFLNGSQMKSAQRKGGGSAHTANVSRLVNLPSGGVNSACSDVLLSISWDGTLRLWDDRWPDGVKLLRSMRNPHGTRKVTHLVAATPSRAAHIKSSVQPVEITAFAFSSSLSLFATCAANGTLRVWDFESLAPTSPIMQEWGGSLSLGDSASEEEAASSPSMVSLCFLDSAFEPLPVVVSGDATGRVALWAVRPSKVNDAHRFIGRLYTSRPGRAATALLSHFVPAHTSADVVRNSTLPEEVLEGYALHGTPLIEENRASAVRGDTAAASGAEAGAEADAGLETGSEADGEAGAATPPLPQRRRRGSYCASDDQWLLVGDDAGWVLGWRVSKLIKSGGSRSTRISPVPAKKQARNGNGFNAWRRLAKVRDFAQFDDGRAVSRPPLPPSDYATPGAATDLSPLAAPDVAFQVHESTLVSLSVVDRCANKSGALLSLSVDGSSTRWAIEVWSIDGACLGRIVNQCNAAGTFIGLARDERVPWSMNPGHRQRDVEETEAAVKMLKAIAEEKSGVNGVEDDFSDEGEENESTTNSPSNADEPHQFAAASTFVTFEVTETIPVADKPLEAAAAEKKEEEEEVEEGQRGVVHPRMSQLKECAAAEPTKSEEEAIAAAEMRAKVELRRERREDTRRALEKLAAKRDQRRLAIMQQLNSQFDSSRPGTGGSVVVTPQTPMVGSAATALLAASREGSRGGSRGASRGTTNNLTPSGSAAPPRSAGEAAAAAAAEAPEAPHMSATRRTTASRHGRKSERKLRSMYSNFYKEKDADAARKKATSSAHGVERKSMLSTARPAAQESRNKRKKSKVARRKKRTGSARRGPPAVAAGRQSVTPSVKTLQLPATIAGARPPRSRS